MDYHTISRHVSPVPPNAMYALPFLVLLAALMSPKPRHEVLMKYSPAFLASLAAVWYQMGNFDMPTFYLLLWAIYLVVLKDPRKDFKQLPPTPKSNAQPCPPFSWKTYSWTSFKDRAAWSLSLMASPRLNFWKTGELHHDTTQPPPASKFYKTRKEYLVFNLAYFALAYFILDLGNALAWKDPYFFDFTARFWDPLPIEVLRGVPLIAPISRMLVIFASCWSALAIVSCLAGLQLLLLNVLGLLSDSWSPHNYTTLFGSPSAIFLFGVKGVWAKVWHSLLRIAIAEPGHALAQELKLPPRSIQKYTVITFTAFTLSGILHTGIIPPEPLVATDSVNQLKLRMLAFFMVQPFALEAEALVSHYAIHKAGNSQYFHCGPGLWLRVAANAVWVVTWFTLCAPLFAEVLKQLEYFQCSPVPVSIVRGKGGGFAY